MKRSEFLRGIIKDAAEKINKGSIAELVEHANIFRSMGITANMHVGGNENGEMDQDNEESKALKYEWFAGALVDIEEKGAYFAVNSWINMSDGILG